MTLTQGSANAASLPADPSQATASTTFSLKTVDGKIAEFQVQYDDGALSIKPLNDSAAALAKERGNNKKLIAASGMLAAQQDLIVNTQQVTAVYLH